METGGTIAEVGLLPFARIALQVFGAAHSSYRAETAALAAMVGAGGRRGFGSAARVVATHPARSVKRLREFASRPRSSFPTNRHRVGAGQREVR